MSRAQRESLDYKSEPRARERQRGESGGHYTGGTYELRDRKGRKGAKGDPGQESSGGHRAVYMPAVCRWGCSQFTRHPDANWKKRCPLWVDKPHEKVEYTKQAESCLQDNLEKLESYVQ